MHANFMNVTHEPLHHLSNDKYLSEEPHRRFYRLSTTLRSMELRKENSRRRLILFFKRRVIIFGHNFIGGFTGQLDLSVSPH